MSSKLTGLSWHGKRPIYKRYFQDFAHTLIDNFGLIQWRYRVRADPKIYVVQTPTALIERCILMTTDPGDLVLDPTCGSGTTAYVAEQWGRRWITIDTSRVALALARARLMARAIPSTSSPTAPRAARKEQEVSGRIQPRHADHEATSARASSTSACRTSR